MPLRMPQIPNHLTPLDRGYLLSCPSCHFGSGQMYVEFADRDEWERHPCHRCGTTFNRRESVDEMFVRGDGDGYALWTDGRLRCGIGQCVPGRAYLLDLRGEFSSVYRVMYGYSGSSVLSGGVATKYIMQGYAMVALAPSPDYPDPSPIDLVLEVVGQRPGAEPLRLWKRQLLTARLSARETPELAVISAVNAVDLFVEDLTRQDMPRGGRPQSWASLLLAERGIDVQSVLAADWERVVKLNRLRNALAHGRDSLDELDADDRHREESWRERSHLYEGDRDIAPSANLAMRAALRFIRAAEQPGPPGHRPSD